VGSYVCCGWGYFKLTTDRRHVAKNVQLLKTVKLQNRNKIIIINNNNNKLIRSHPLHRKFLLPSCVDPFQVLLKLVIFTISTTLGCGLDGSRCGNLRSHMCDGVSYMINYSRHKECVLPGCIAC
jgi:hypothetical protein